VYQGRWLRYVDFPIGAARLWFQNNLNYLYDIGSASFWPKYLEGFLLAGHRSKWSIHIFPKKIQPVLIPNKTLISKSPLWYILLINKHIPKMPAPMRTLIKLLIRQL
jgi:hypothetical protein